MNKKGWKRLKKSISISFWMCPAPKSWSKYTTPFRPCWACQAIFEVHKNFQIGPGVAKFGRVIMANEDSVGIRNPTIPNLGIFEILNFEDLISNGPIFKGSGYTFSYRSGPDHSKCGHFCWNFKWLGFWISDPVQNSDHLQNKLFFNIQNLN